MDAGVGFYSAAFLDTVSYDSRIAEVSRKMLAKYCIAMDCI